MEVEIPLLPEADDSEEGDVMDWEDELHNNVHPTTDIRGWEELHKQIDVDLKKGEKTLPVSKTRKLMLIRNFVMLRLKGFGRMEASQEIAQQWHWGDGTHFAHQIQKLAWHYQVFEQLPLEKRGGAWKGHTLLLDEWIRNAAREWLTAQPAGDITSRCFQTALNSTILPNLSVVLKQPLSTRTAHWWLL